MILRGTRRICPATRISTRPMVAPFFQFVLGQRIVILDGYCVLRGDPGLAGGLFGGDLAFGHHFLLDGVDHLGAAFLHLLLLVAGEIAEHPAQAPIEEGFSLFACLADIIRVVVELLDRVLNPQQPHILAPGCRFDQVTDDGDQTADVSGGMHAGHGVLGVQSVGHLVGSNLAQFLDEVLLDDQVANVFFALDDVTVRRQADGDHADLLVLAIHDVDDIVQHVTILEQFRGGSLVLIEDVLVEHQELQTLVELRVHPLHGFEGLQEPDGMIYGTLDLALEGVPLLLREQLIAQVAGLVGIDLATCQTVIDCTQLTKGFTFIRGQMALLHVAVGPFAGTTDLVLFNA